MRKAVCTLTREINSRPSRIYALVMVLLVERRGGACMGVGWPLSWREASSGPAGCTGRTAQLVGVVAAGPSSRLVAWQREVSRVMGVASIAPRGARHGRLAVYGEAGQWPGLVQGGGDGGEVSGGS